MSAERSDDHGARRRLMKQLLAVSLVMTMLGLAVLPVTAQPVTIGVSLPQDDNPFYIAMLKGIRARAQELGWQVASVSSNEDKLRQINGVQDLLAKDEKQIGRDIASWTAQRIGGKGKVAMISGPPGAPTFRNLNEGYLEVMAKYPSISVVARNEGALTRERGLKVAEDALVAHPDLAAIYTANDDVALGAAQAVAASGRVGKTIVTGMNGVPPALKAVKDGNVGMTVELNPVLWGRLGVDVLAAYLKGERTEQRVFIKHVIIDPANVDDAISRVTRS